jgi:hypothetical protein
MADGLSLDPPEFDPGPLATRGQVHTPSGTNIATVVGLTPGSFADVNGPVFFGLNVAGPAAPFFMTSTQATAVLNLFTSTLQGLVPASGGGTTNFLRADGTWAPPPGGVTPTWAQVLATGRFTGGVGNNPHVDSGDILSFGVAGSLPPTGTIRSSTDIEMRAAGGIELTSDATMQLQAVGLIPIRFVTDATERLRIGGDGAWRIDGDEGTAGQVLTSNGAGATPTWEDAPGGGSQGWDDVLAVDNSSGANNPHIDTGQFIGFGVEGSLPGSGQLRSSANWTAQITGSASFVGSTAVFVTGGGSGLSASAAAFTMAAGSAAVVGLANSTLQLQAGGSDSIRLLTNSVERLEIEGAGAWQLGGVVGSAGQYIRSAGAGAPPTWATIAVGEISGIVATTGAVAIPAGGGASTFAGIRDNGSAENDRANLNFVNGTNTTSSVTDDAGSDELEIRWDWNGLQARRNSGTFLTARRRFNFVEGANISITLNSDATDDENEVTVAVTGLTSSGAVTGAVAIAAGGGASTFSGIRDNGAAENDRANLNFLSGTHTTAAITDDAGNNELEITYGVNLSTLVPAIDSTSVIANGTVLERAAVTGAIAMAQNANTSLFAGIRDNGAAETDRTNLNFVNGTNTTATVTDDAANDELEIRFNVDNFPLSGLADQADHTVVANVSGAAGPPTAVLWDDIAGDGLLYSNATHKINVLVGPGSHLRTDVGSGVLLFHKDRIRDTWWEEFTFAQTLSGGTAVTTSGTVAHGQSTNWWMVATGASGSWDVGSVGVSQGHPGIWRLTTGATSGNSMAMYNGVAQTLGLGMYRGQDIYMAEAILRMTAVTTRLWEFGFRDTAGNNFIEFYADTSAATGSTTLIHTYTEEGGAITDNNTAITDTANAWVALTMLQETIGTIDFYIDDVLTNSHSTNVPDSEAMSMFFRVTTRTAAARSLEIDYCMFESQNLGASNRTT